MENYLGNKVRETREHKMMTQEELAGWSGLNIRTIQRIESGETSPRSDTIILLSQSLDIDPSYLFEKKQESSECSQDKNMRTDNTLIYAMYASGIIFMLNPVWGVLLPLVIWLSIRKKVAGANEHGRRVIIVQLAMLVVWFLAVNILSPAIAGDISPEKSLRLKYQWYARLTMFITDAVILLVLIIRLKLSLPGSNKRTHSSIS